LLVFDEIEKRVVIKLCHSFCGRRDSVSVTPRSKGGGNYYFLHWKYCPDFLPWHALWCRRRQAFRGAKEFCFKLARKIFVLQTFQKDQKRYQRTWRSKKVFNLSHREPFSGENEHLRVKPCPWKGYNKMCFV